MYVELIIAQRPGKVRLWEQCSQGSRHVQIVVIIRSRGSVAVYTQSRECGLYTQQCPGSLIVTVECTDPGLRSFWIRMRVKCRRDHHRVVTFIRIVPQHSCCKTCSKQRAGEGCTHTRDPPGDLSLQPAPAPLRMVGSHGGAWRLVLTDLEAKRRHCRPLQLLSLIRRPQVATAGAR